jgi:hypothetical protein
MSRLVHPEDSESRSLLDHYDYEDDLEDCPNSRTHSFPPHTQSRPNSRSNTTGTNHYNPDDPWAVFHQPTPSPCTRVALLVFIGLMLWLGFLMRTSMLGGIGGALE